MSVTQNGCCLLSANLQRLAVFFPPRQEQTLQQTLSDSAKKIRGELKSMLPDESAVYYPEELSLLGTVLDQLVQSLPPNLRTPCNRTALAKNILACASAGERDPDALRRGALLNSKVAVAA